MKHNMKMTLLSLLATVATIGTASFAKAEASDLGLFVEPGITYERGSTKVDWPSPFSSQTGESNGLGLMGRVGLHVADILFVGLDGRYSMPNYKDSLPYSADATQFNWGPLVGVQTPIFGIRVWGNYIAGGVLDPKASGNLDVKFNNPTGYRVGVGGRFLMFSVNLEYQNLKYDSITVESYGGYNANTNFSNTKPTNESWIVSLSFPISI